MLTRSSLALRVAVWLFGGLVALAPAAYAAWPHDPNNGNVALCTAASNQYFPTIVSDGSGGAIITWNDLRSGNYDIYAQRVNAAGVPQWTANGVALCSTANDQSYPTIVSDGTGGAIVTWYDYRSGSSSDIYAQRLNAAGVPQWTVDGVALCTAANDQGSPTIVSDGTGGAIVTWHDLRSGTNYDIYGQRVNAAGVPQWTASGVALCTAANDQNSPTIVSDGIGGAIVTWYDLRSGTNYDIFAQRVNAAGVPQWTASGVALCSAANSQYSPTIVSDGTGGAIVTWYDYRSGSYSDIYAQRVNAAGVPQWTADGVTLSTAAYYRQYPTIVSDGSGGAIVTWKDYRSGISYDTYAQRVNAAGVPQWTANGVALCVAANTQDSPTIASDGSGGAIVTWADYRSSPSTSDIYAQRIERFGFLGNPEPSIVSVRDVRNDQGGKVSIRWTASYLDVAPYNPVDQYWIWRQVPIAGAPSLTPKHGDPPVRGNARIVRPAVGSTYYWELVGTQASHGFPAYSFTASTAADSVPGSAPNTIFMVEAEQAWSGEYWGSSPDSGYSVDNLAPFAPAPFTAAYSSGAMHLHWGANTEADLASYRLYRGGSAGFVPGPTNLIAAPPDTGYNDVGSSGSYYKLSAVDVHGNESPFAALGPGDVGVPDPNTLPHELLLGLPVPNPMRAAATLRLELPLAGEVRVAVYDEKGRVVRQILDGPMPAGVQALRWDRRDATGRRAASGVYVVRLTTGAASRSRKLIVE